MYGYVGIENGFQTDMVMNSRSFYKGITDKDKLEKGDILPFVKTSLTPKSNSNLKTPFTQNGVIDIETCNLRLHTSKSIQKVLSRKS